MVNEYSSSTIDCIDHSSLTIVKGHKHSLSLVYPDDTAASVGNSGQFVVIKYLIAFPFGCECFFMEIGSTVATVATT